MIRKPTWIALGMFLALAALAAGLRAWQTHQERAGLATPIPTSDLLLPAGMITALRIEEKGQAVEMHLDDEGAWQVSAPVQDLGDGLLIGGVVSQLQSATVLSRFATPPTLETVGLSAPAAQLTIGMADGASVTLDLGNQTVTGSGYYVRINGGAPVVVNRYLLDGALGLLDNPPVAATVAPTMTPSP